MKFDSFCKKYMPYVHTVEMDGKKWACSGNVYMLLGENAGTIGKVEKSDPVLDEILNNATWGRCEAHLSHAFLRKPDGKASDIMRQFADNGCVCDIRNAHFGLIEKRDMCVIAEWYDKDEIVRHALLVGPPVADIDNFEPTGIILEWLEA